MNSIKRFLFLLFFIILFSITVLKVKAEGNINVSAQCAVMLESHTKRVMYEKSAHEQRPVASISKIMTAIIAIENAPLDEYVTISKYAARQIGSSLYLKVGEEVTFRDLIYGLMLRSGNDAAYAIAEYIGNGDIDYFVYLMNEKAKALGLKKSVFGNPSGLDELSQNLSTAYDMALITKYAMDNPIFREINNTSTYRATTKAGSVYVWHNKHRLINHYDFIIGGKTGYTKLAKRTLVSVGNKSGLELIVVTLNSGNDWNDHLQLFNYGFTEFDLYTLIEKGIFEVKALDEIFYVDEKIVYPLKKNEFAILKIVFDVDEKTNITYLLVVKDQDILYKKEVYKYDSTHSVLKNSLTIIDIWDGMKLFVRELFW